MNNKFTAEILDKYKLGRITSEDTFEYGKGYIKIDDSELAEFDKLEIHIQPIIKEVSLRKSDGDNKVVVGYKPIYVSLNISKKYSRYNEINGYSQLDIEISDGIIISKCNIKEIKNGNNMILQNVRIENIEMI